MNPSMAVMAVLAALFAAGLGVALWRLKSMRARLAALGGDQARARETQRELSDKERKQSKALEAVRDELESVKHELAAQKKKNHTVQEETKKLRGELRDKSEEMTRVRNERPAFESKAPRSAETTKSAEPTKREPRPDPTAMLAAEVTAELVAQRERLRELAALHDGLVQKVNSEELGHAQARAELARLRKRIEDYRRIDLVSKGKVAVLEDRLRGMGRQYYEAVSELALLKGEVQPPPPQDVADSLRDGRGGSGGIGAAEAEGRAADGPPAQGDLPPEHDEAPVAEAGDSPNPSAPAASRPE
ncbi:MAG: hypothetical protein HYZ27_10965 [Deltaproteobacteria bacterium]|nr:hypothetical protein [Deltaproteobacteria bacterium]